MEQFVYVIELHAVQFGNNWMRKIPFGSPRNYLNPSISKLDKHVGRITYQLYCVLFKGKK